MKRKIRKIWICFLLGALFILRASTVTTQAAEWPTGIDIEGGTAIVMEASTGTILYEKNIHEEHYPASITKIMTALLALENCSLDEEVVFSEDAVYKTEGSGIARDVGEVMTMEQCLYGLMLASANECAYAIAEHVGGNYAAFIRMMNEKAAQLGCENTHFNNPHGLPDENHYTSVYDMALIAREALKNDTFCLISGTRTYTIPPTNKHAEETYLTNTHKMLNNYKGAEFLYEDCIGGKTGYTSAARNTLVTFARRDGMTLICVVLDEKATKQYLDTTALFDYCFDNFQVWNIAENETYYTPDMLRDVLALDDNDEVLLDGAGSIVLPKTAAYEDASAEVVKQEDPGGMEGGTVEYTYAGKPVGKADIIVSRKAESETVNRIPQEQEKKRSVSFKKILKRVVILLILAGVGGVIFFLACRIYWLSRRRRRRRRNTYKRINSYSYRRGSGRRRRMR